MNGSEHVGTIETWTQPWGFELDFIDHQGIVHRIEKRDSQHQLLPGACITTFEYDDGRIVEERWLNLSGQSMMNDDGYAVCRWRYSQDPEHFVVVEKAYLDAAGRPVSTRSGFAVIRETKDGANRTRRLEFLNAGYKPAPSSWLEITNVVKAEYAYLQGVTPVVCVTLFDGSGNVLERLMISGSTYERR
jgi:hypothetical protein